MFLTNLCCYFWYFVTMLFVSQATYKSTCSMYRIELLTWYQTFFTISCRLSFVLSDLMCTSNNWYSYVKRHKIDIYNFITIMVRVKRFLDVTCKVGSQSVNRLELSTYTLESLNTLGYTCVSLYTLHTMYQIIILNTLPKPQCGLGRVWLPHYPSDC